VTITELCRFFYFKVARACQVRVSRGQPTDRPDDRTTEIPRRLERGQQRRESNDPFPDPRSASPPWSWAIPKTVLPSPHPKTTPPTAYPSPSLPNLPAPLFNPLADSPLLPMSHPLFPLPPSSVAQTGLPYQHAHPPLGQPANWIITLIPLPPCQNTLAAKT